MKESRGREQFCKNIDNIIHNVNIENINTKVINAFMNIMPMGVDVFSMHMETWIVC